MPITLVHLSVARSVRPAQLLVKAEGARKGEGDGEGRKWGEGGRELGEEKEKEMGGEMRGVKETDLEFYLM